MPSKKPDHKIIFDTNLVFLNDENRLDVVFSSHLHEVRKFLSENHLGNITLAMPEMVVSERVSQRLTDSKKTLGNLEGATAALKKVHIKIPKHTYDEAKMRVWYFAQAKKELRRQGVQIIKTPQINQQEINDRLFNVTPPFTKQDKGFKDTVIWLTVLDDAQKNKNTNYIFCTNNTDDFDPASLTHEFALHSKREFSVFKTTDDLKVYLDKKLVLKLDIQERNQQIRTEIESRIGSLMVEVNGYKQRRNPYDWDMLDIYRSDAVHTATGYGIDKKRDTPLEGYDFAGLEVTDISKTNNNTFKVELHLAAIQKYGESPDQKDPLGLFEGAYSVRLRPNPWADDGPVRLSVSILYDRDTGSIRVTSLYRQY